MFSTTVKAAERSAGHLQVPVDDGRLALVQSGNGLTGVAEDVEDLDLAEAHAEPLVHLLDHLARCGRGGRGKRRSQRIPRRYTFKRGGLTFAVLHEDQHLPDAVRHSADGRVQVPDDVFMARQLFLWEGPRDQTSEQYKQ